MEKIFTKKDILEKGLKTLVEGTEGENNPKKSGDVKVYKLSDKTIKILEDRIKDEYTAHYYYRAATNWCKDMNYKKAAAFFESEAADELEHAKMLEQYMTDFNIIPSIQKANTTHTFDNLIDIVNGAYEMELGLMESYNKDSHTVFNDDITTFDILSKFRKIQRKAVIEYNDLINGSNLVDKKDKFQVLYFENTYF